MEPAIAVIGAGTMGTGIAQLAAAAGHRVFLFDSADGAVADALMRMRERLDRSVARGRRTEDETREINERIVGCGSLAECASAGLIIEAIVEDIGVKQQVLSDVENLVDDSAIVATNTSSLSVTKLASCLERPERFVGMHFFNPAPVMPLVEIVAGAETATEIVDAAAATVVSWGKTPVRCASTPGFIVNRVARPFYGEAIRLSVEGTADYATIDAVITGSGRFRMGPFALMDLVGIDVNLAVSKSVYHQSFHDPRFAPHPIQQSLVDAGRLGRKSGRGFYDYASPQPEPPSSMDPSPAPRAVEAHGDLGWARGLVERLAGAGIEVGNVDADSPGHFVLDDVYVVPTDGRTATELVAKGVLGTNNVAVFDLVHDWDGADRIGLSVADQADPGTAGRTAGLLQAVGLEVSLLDDTPGLVVMRTVAQLVAVAADAVTQRVASPEDIDTAMKLGTNYPSGPLEWADRIGLDRVVAALGHLHEASGEDRYRVPMLIKRRALTGGSLRV